jgi:hypothetical protein
MDIRESAREKTRMETIGKLSAVSSHLAKMKAAVDVLMHDLSALDGMEEAIGGIVEEWKGHLHWSSEILDEVCPKCGSVKIKKTNISSGRSFIGCSNYPVCQWKQKNSLSNTIAARIRGR